MHPDNASSPNNRLVEGTLPGRVSPPLNAEVVT